MGQVCSGEAVRDQVNFARDPDDKQLEEVEMKITKIPDFDSFFEKAGAPLNELVEIHNGIADGEEALKEAAAAIQGEPQVKLQISHGGSVELVFWYFNENEQEEIYSPEQIAQKVGSDPKLQEAYNHTREAVDALNNSKSNGGASSTYMLHRGRLHITKKGAQDSYVRDVNITIFTLRRRLMMNANTVALGDGAKVFIREISKVVNTKDLNVKADEKGVIRIYGGNKEIDLKNIENLTKPAQQLCDTLVDLLKNIEIAATSVPELAEACSAFVEEAQGFPAKVPEAVSSSGLGITEVPKATSNTGSNVKALRNGPKIAKATSAIIAHVGTELKNAASVPVGY